MNSQADVLSDNIIYRILNWNYEWIEEQNNQSASNPPILGAATRSSETETWNISKLTLTRVTSTFDDLSSYLSIFYSMMFHEVWANICSDIDRPIYSVDFRIRVKPSFQDGFAIIDLPSDEQTWHDMDLVSVTIEQENQMLTQKFFGLIKENVQNFALQLWITKTNVPKKPCNCTVTKVFPFKQTLNSMMLMAFLDSSPLCNVILNPNRHLSPFKLPKVDVSLNQTHLNASQYEALESISMAILDTAIGEPKLALLHGPPGTGKTHVIIELITRLMLSTHSLRKDGEVGEECLPRILVCTPSNSAVDEIATRFRAECRKKDHDFKILRIGGDKVSPLNLEVSFDVIVRENCKKNMLQSLSDKIEVLTDRKNRTVSRIRGAKNSKESRRQGKILEEIENDLEEVNKSYNKYYETSANQMKIEKDMFQRTQKKVASEANVIFSTLNSCRRLELLLDCNTHSNKFLCCIFDESSQCSEPEAIAPIALGINKLVFIGDPKQLPGTVVSQAAKNYGFEKSLFERLCSVRKTHGVMMLTTQYRMSPAICEWPSEFFYGGRLRTVENLPRNGPCYDYRVIDVIDGREQPEENSVANVKEAELVVRILKVITNSPLTRTKTVSVITFYINQKKLLRNMIRDEGINTSRVEINTVDSFQGQERDIIIISCVRAHEENKVDKIGFLSSLQRLNVSVTRAKETLIICGHLDTLRMNNAWKSLIGDARKRGFLSVLSSDENEARLRAVILRNEN